VVYFLSHLKRDWAGERGVAKKRGEAMKKYIFISVFVLVFLCCAAYLYAAQDTDTQTSNVSLNVPEAARLGITSANASKTLNQGGDTEAAFDAGYVDFATATPTLTVSANKKWKLYIRTSNFAGPYAKDVSDLMVKDAGAAHVTNGFNDFKSLSLDNQEIASHTGPIKNESHPVQYRILLDWTKDIAGTYTATVTYTLATQA